MEEQKPLIQLDEAATEQLDRNRTLAVSARASRAQAERPVELLEENRRFHNYVKVLYKRRWLAITTFLLITLGTMVYTFTATPVYRASTRLLIEVDDPNVVNFKEVIDEQQSKADYYTTQYNILQSRSLARLTLDALKLWDTPPFGTEDGESTGFSLAGVVAKTGSFVTGLWRSAEPKVVDREADETAAQSRAISAMLKRLRVSPIRNSRLVDLSYELQDAGMATAIVNALARNYISQNLEYKFLATKDATDWLTDRLSEQRTQMEAAERALQKYREENGATSLTDRENIVVQKLTQLNTEVTRAKTERIQQEAMFVQLQSLQGDRARLETFPAILGNAFIQGQKTVLADLLRQQAQLAETYGDKNERMIKIKSEVEGAQAKLDMEIQKVVQSVRTEYQAAVARERSLIQALDEQKAEALSMNSKAIEYNVLDRDVESAKGMYNTLMLRTKETGLSGALKTSNVRIVDQAEKPLSPAWPDPRLNLVGIIGGVVAAIGLVVLFEFMDDRIKSPDEIQHYLGLPHLGLLPLVHKRQTKKSGYPLLNASPPNDFAEAFRVVRTNVLFSSADLSSQSILITSTGPGEGKSLIAADLAISLAQAGERVLLIDADMRKPTVHTMFAQPQEPGLSNFLIGAAKTSEVVRKSSVAGLWVLTSGRVPPNPAELLGSSRCTDVFEKLKEHFDWVVIDSPPIMAVVDASIIAHAASGVLFVVGADMTSRTVARRAVDQLESTGAKFFGAVLNRADLKHNAYYYSQYYRREYSEYYQKGGSK